MSSDQGFPEINYKEGDSFLNWGRSHGEEFKVAIKELVEIRRELMLQKNPRLISHLTRLAHEQFDVTKDFCPEICEELNGIAQGSDLTVEDIVILNNYTDFRDIQLPEEGCSTIHKKNEKVNVVGQTWDMHSSAKDYACVIKAPTQEHIPASISFSLVGCVGMMGVNSNKLFTGVNNINTTNAKVGLIWPALVRKCLMAIDLDELRTILTTSPVTSGHNYIIADFNKGEHWEISPGIIEKVLDSEIDNHIFHTNHCLGPQTKEVEDKTSHSSTTLPRFDILTSKYDQVSSQDEFIALLKSHEGYPKSICSHFESGAQDPSMTCGGGTFDFATNDLHIWRGCKVHDKNYREYNYNLS